MSIKQSNTKTVRRVALSYAFTQDAPYPQGGRPLKITVDKSLTGGDISNSSVIHLWNHLGTHIDGPSHMLADCGPLTDYILPTGLFLTNPLLVEVPCSEDDKLITAADLEQAMPQGTDCDILLLRTGFGQYRASDPQRYATKNPGLDISAAQYIVDHCLRTLCLAIDSISFSALGHASEGIEAHRTLLGNRPPIMLIEDVDLDHNLSGLQRVIVLPMFIEGLDSCPCIVIAELNE